MKENLDHYYTPLDTDLQNLANSDWPAFVKLVGEDNIRNAKICILRKRGKSLNEIAIKLRTTKRVAERSCGKCHQNGADTY